MLKKDINNVELCKLAAKKLGLKTETMRSGPEKTLLYVTDGKKFYLASSAAPGMFPKALRWNANFTGSKLLTQKILKKFGYKVIPSKEMRVADFKSAKALTKALGQNKHSFPILIKPDRGMNAKNIVIAEDLKHLKKTGEKLHKAGKDFMIQPILNQDEYRILVVNYKVVLMHSKHTYHVKGDGKSTIKQLLAKVVPERTDATCIAWQHKKLGTKPSTVLEKDAKFEYHITKGATHAFYETKNFPLATKKWAFDLAKTVSSPVVGIDVFIKGDFNDTSSYTIIELNTNPGLHYLVEYCKDGETGLRIFTDILKDYFKIR